MNIEKQTNSCEREENNEIKVENTQEEELRKRKTREFEEDAKTGRK